MQEFKPVSSLLFLEMPQVWGHSVSPQSAFFWNKCLSVGDHSLSSSRVHTHRARLQILLEEACLTPRFSRTVRAFCTQARVNS